MEFILGMVCGAALVILLGGFQIRIRFGDTDTKKDE